ncbi:MAG: GGDEF domain-containing protein [Actinomycetota bacterium]
MTPPPADPAESVDLADAIARGRVDALIPAVRRSMVTSVLSVVVFSVLLARFNPIGLGLWLGLRAITSAGCVAALAHVARRAAISSTDTTRWLAALMGVSGVVWGAIPAFVRPEAPEWRAVVVLWLFGNQAVVTAVTSPARSVFLAAIGSVTLVGAAAIGIGGGQFGLALAALLLLGGAYSVAIFATFHRTVEASITARWDASRLAGSLAERQAELEAANDVLAHLAAHDNLTGLLNRRALTEALTGGSGTETLVGSGWIGFVDVDHFKAVNDTYGHRAGDEVLVAVARRWSASLEPGVTLARAGGDEFIVALPPSSSEDATRIVDRLVHRLVEPVTTSAGSILVTCSIGATEYRDGESLTAVLARADAALYTVKDQGRNASVVAPWPHAGSADRAIAPG